MRKERSFWRRVSKFLFLWRLIAPISYWRWNFLLHFNPLIFCRLSLSWKMFEGFISTLTVFLSFIYAIFPSQFPTNLLLIAATCIWSSFFSRFSSSYFLSFCFATKLTFLKWILCECLILAKKRDQLTCGIKTTMILFSWARRINHFAIRKKGQIPRIIFALMLLKLNASI